MQDFQRKKYFAKLYDVSYCKNLKGIRMWRWEQIRQKKKVFEVSHLLSPGDLAEMLPLLWAQSKACHEST